MATIDSFLDCKDACDELMEVCQLVKEDTTTFIRMAKHFQMFLEKIEDHYWEVRDFQSLTDKIKGLTDQVNLLIKMEKHQVKIDETNKNKNLL